MQQQPSQNSPEPCRKLVRGQGWVSAGVLSHSCYLKQHIKNKVQYLSLGNRTLHASGRFNRSKSNCCAAQPFFQDLGRNYSFQGLLQSFPLNLVLRQQNCSVQRVGLSEEPLFPLQSRSTKGYYNCQITCNSDSQPGILFIPEIRRIVWEWRVALLTVVVSFKTSWSTETWEKLWVTSFSE